MRTIGGLAVLLGLLACGSENLPVGEDHHIHTCTGTYLCPLVAHSGYDGSSVFKTTFWTSLKNPTWRLEDPSMGAIHVVSAPPGATDPGASWAVVETSKAGTTQVIAQAGDTTLEAEIVISQYTPAQVVAGSTRFYQPAHPGGRRVACVSCHGTVAGIDPSPLVLSVFTDDELLSAIEKGAFPDGLVVGVDHDWDLTDEERAGIVPFLRSMADGAVD